jgi:exonuclease SbcD
MRIIHTSDWHIGRRFEREPMEAEQRAFLDWLATLVADRRIDLVVVAGDIFDRSLPSEEAVALLDAGLDGVRSAGADVVMISGNHDSPRRLGFGARRQALGGVHISADDQHPPVPWVFARGDERMAIVATPFLDPHVAPAPGPDADGGPRPRTHENALIDALAAARHGLAGLGPMPTLAVAHAFVAGSSVSDSERQLAIGGADAVSATVFDGFDYVALGHLHRPQRIDGRDDIAYSGSPLPYSFSEDHQKSVRSLELTSERLLSVEEVPIPVGRPVCTLTGTLAELLEDDTNQRFRHHWVAVKLTDDHAQVQPLERLRARFPHVVSVRYDTRGGGGPLRGPAELADGVEERPAAELVLGFLAELRDRPATDGERSLVHGAVATARAGTER